MWLFCLLAVAVLFTVVGDAILRRLDALIAQGELFMSTLQEVRDSIAALKTAVLEAISAEGTQVSGAIQALVDQLGAGGVVTVDDLTALKNDLDAAREEFVARVGGIYEPAPPVEG